MHSQNIRHKNPGVDLGCGVVGADAPFRDSTTSLTKRYTLCYCFMISILGRPTLTFFLKAPICTKREGEARADRTRYFSQPFQKESKTTFLACLFSKICLQRKFFGQTWVFTVFCFGRNKKNWQNFENLRKSWIRPCKHQFSFLFISHVKNSFLFISHVKFVFFSWCDKRI